MRSRRNQTLNESGIDPERVAALLDGRLDGKARDEVLAKLAASDAALWDFVEAVLLSRDAHAAGATAAVVPIAARRHERWWADNKKRAAVAVAVGGLVAASVALVLTRAGTPADIPAYVAGLRQPTLPAQWESRPWRVTRGTRGALSATARAARVGALLVDLDLRSRVADTASRSLAADIADLVADIPASAPTVTLLHTLSRSDNAPPDSVRTRLQLARSSAVILVGTDLANLGAWVETARIAASTGDTRFFRSRLSRDALDRGATLGSLPPETRTAFVRLRERALEEPDRRTSSLEEETTAVLALLTR